MAIGISSAGSSARGIAAGAPYAPASRTREATAARSGSREGGPTAVDEAGAAAELPSARVRELRVDGAQRVQRLESTGGSEFTNRGIAAYLEVERGTVTDPAGGELVGIDFYV